MKITENISISLGMVIALSGGIIWLTEEHFLSVSTAAQVDELSKKHEEFVTQMYRLQDHHNKELEEIRIRLTHIEDAVKN